MGFWIAAGAFSAMVAMAVLAAYLRPRGSAVPVAAYDLQVYRDQLQELDRDLARGVYAAGSIDSGEAIGSDAVYFAMPRQEGQLSSGEFGRYRASYQASRSYDAHQPIREEAEPDPVSDVREILHDAKGMLFEARIEPGDGNKVELSHHYGVERFREVGAIFIHVLNREYCKKLGIMLPGQSHPTHRHTEKEETFQLLWGDLTVERDGETVELAPGDTLLIERGTPHAFASRNGGIFEEISTTDVRGDSRYDDPAINRLDPMQRKTILEEW